MKLSVRNIPGKIWAFLRRRWKLLLVLLVVVAGVGFWQYQRVQKNKPTYTFVKPSIQTISKTLNVSGVIDAEEKANLRFAAGGKVVYIGAQEGDFVTKNQTLATIDQRELQKRLQQDLNAYLRERWDWETSQDATDYNVENLATRRDLDQQQTNLNDTVLNVEIRDIAIQNTVLKAPFSGLLVASPLTVTGVNLLATDVFELVNPDTLVFKAAVDEADIGQVRVGQAAAVTLDSYPDNPISSNVQSISYKSSQTSSGTVFVVRLPITVADLPSELRLGMNGDATITLNTKENVLAIPLDTTRQRDGKTYVDIKTGPSTVAEREITTGLETDDMVEVTQGLTVNDEVVVPNGTQK